MKFPEEFIHKLLSIPASCNRKKLEASVEKSVGEITVLLDQINQELDNYPKEADSPRPRQSAAN